MDYNFGASLLNAQRYELTHARVPFPLQPKRLQRPASLLTHHARVVGRRNRLC
jgi:hypothetical protein